MARDIFLSDNLGTEKNAINDTRAIDGAEQTTQQAILTILEVLQSDRPTQLSAGGISEIESRIRATLQEIDDVGIVSDVTVTSVEDTTINLSVTTSVIDFEQPFEFPQ